MLMIYNSPNYCVVEFRDAEGQTGGFEIMDKASRREIFIEGSLAMHFRDDVRQLIASQPSVEEVDDFLSRFDGLMQQPMLLH
jgi:Protein of unknown function (DUF3567)